MGFKKKCVLGLSPAHPLDALLKLNARIPRLFSPTSASLAKTGRILIRSTSRNELTGQGFFPGRSGRYTDDE